MKVYRFIVFVLVFIVSSFYILNNCSFATSFLPKNFSLHFKEEHTSRFSKRVKETIGVLHYSWPSSLRVDIIKPRKTTYIYFKKTSWFFTKSFSDEPNELNISHKSKFQLVKVFQILSSDIFKKSQYFSVKSKKNRVLLTIKKNSKLGLNFSKIALVFSPQTNIATNTKLIEKYLFSNLKALLLVDIKGKIKKFKIEKLLKTKKSKTIFIFKIPKNTRVNRE